MANPERFGTFYAIWPILDGKPLNLQWGEIRSNQAELKALARNSFQELEEDVDELNAQRALEGQAYGDLAFSKKYRLFYNKATLEFCCQRNTGTVNSPVWVDAWCVRFSDGQFQAVGEGGIRSAAGFYGPGLQSIEEVAESGSEADVSIRNPTKIFFNANDGFGVQPIASGANAGQPEIRFTQPFGRAQAFEKSGKVWQVDHNFGITPVMVTVFDQDDRIVTPDTVDVSNPNTTWFYFNSVFSGTAYIASGGVGATTLLPRDPFYLVVRTDDQAAAQRTLKPNADVLFDARYFYVNVDLDTVHGGAHQTAFVSLYSTPGAITDHGQLSGLADDDHTQYLLVDGTRAMTGDLNMGGKDVLNASAGNFNRPVTAEAFYLEPGSGGEFSKSGNDVLIKANTGDIILDDDVQITGDLRVSDKVVAEAFYLATGGELGPAVAQITFRESDNTPPSFLSNTLVFNAENFYLDSTSAGYPQVNLRPGVYDRVGAFSRQQYFVPGVLSISGGNVAWNLDNAQVATLNLTASATLSAPTNIRTGGQYTLIVTQGGGATLSFDASYNFGAAGAPTLSSTAGLRDVLVFMGVGSEMFLTGVSTGY